MSHTDFADINVRSLLCGVVFTATPHLRIGMELSVDFKPYGGDIRSRHEENYSRIHPFFIEG
jgi:hypothetical protein